MQLKKIFYYVFGWIYAGVNWGIELHLKNVIDCRFVALY